MDVKGKLYEISNGNEKYIFGNWRKAVQQKSWLKKVELVNNESRYLAEDILIKVLKE